MLIANQKENKADQWHVVEFPALLDHGPVWPEYWNKDELEKVKATLPVGKWNAQWMQQPTSEEGAIIKREWWRTYTKDYIPSLQHVIQSYDTAFLKRNIGLLSYYYMGYLVSIRGRRSQSYTSRCSQR